MEYITKSESANFARITGGRIADLAEMEIKSDGYVIHTLEAALWCCLNTGNFKDAILKAVNLGSDTDTVGAVAGGLAGSYYGVKEIPEKWISTLVKSDDLWNFCEKLVGIESDQPKSLTPCCPVSCSNKKNDSRAESDETHYKKEN